jgi:hypothetical protein
VPRNDPEVPHDRCAPWKTRPGSITTEIFERIQSLSITPEVWSSIWTVSQGNPAVPHPAGVAFKPVAVDFAFSAELHSVRNCGPRQKSRSGASTTAKRFSRQSGRVMFPSPLCVSQGQRRPSGKLHGVSSGRNGAVQHLYRPRPRYRTADEARSARTRSACRAFRAGPNLGHLRPSISQPPQEGLNAS